MTRFASVVGLQMPAFRRIRPRLVAAVVACAAGLAAAAPAPADAYVVGGDPWPTTTITYWTKASGYADSVDRATRKWNGKNVGVKFRRASNAFDANVILRYGGQPCEGSSDVGFFGQQHSYVDLGKGCSKDFIVITAAHELGHVLGLDHEKHRCARMNPKVYQDGSPNHCAHHPLSYWLGHVILSDDVAGAKALYGG